MPILPLQKSLQSSSELKIVLDSETSLIGGETICGHVLRNSPCLDQHTTIFVRLYGRTEVRIASGGMGAQMLSSCFNLFEDVLKVHEGPVQILPNSTEPGIWPFAITLPKHPNLASLKRNNEDEKSYLPLVDVPSQGLPPTFFTKDVKAGRHTTGCVQYYLEATMCCSNKQKKSLTGNKSNKDFQAIQPLNVQSNSSSIQITDFDTKHRPQPVQKIASQSLVAGVGSRLSVAQQMKKMLNSSQVPSYSFSLQLDFATVLQIGNPIPIPLRLKANTIWKDTSEILQATLPMILVKQFTLTLRSLTLCNSKKLKFHSEGIRCEGSPLVLVDYTSKLDSKSTSNTNATSPSDMLIVPQDSTCPPFDLGIALRIKSPRISRGSNVNPTFITCNIKHTHSLEWKLALIVGGETIKYAGEQPVTVIGPTYDL